MVPHERGQTQHSQCSLEAPSKYDFEVYILLVLPPVGFSLNIHSLARKVGESGERVTSISIAEQPGPILSSRATYSDHNVGSHIASRHFTMTGS